MTRIIEKLTEATGLNIIPVETKQVAECIVYQWYQTALFTYRLQLRVIAFSFAKAELVSTQIMSAINDIGDNNKISGISSINLNGGGSMKDYENDTYQRILYFDVIMKEV